MLSVPGFESLCVCVCVLVVVNDQRLMFRGLELDDDSLLSDYGIDDQSGIYVELPPGYSLMKLVKWVSRTEDQSE